MAIDDANMLCSGQTQLNEEDGEQKYHGGDDYDSDSNVHDGSIKAGKQPGPRADLEAGGARGNSINRAAITKGLGGGRHRVVEDDLSSPSALALQLANRKFNLALCLAAKGNSTVSLGGSPDLNATNAARRLMFECAQIAAEREDATGDQRHVECLLEVFFLWAFGCF